MGSDDKAIQRDCLDGRKESRKGGQRKKEGVGEDEVMGQTDRYRERENEREVWKHNL